MSPINDQQLDQLLTTKMPNIAPQPFSEQVADKFRSRQHKRFWILQFFAVIAIISLCYFLPTQLISSATQAVFSLHVFSAENFVLVLLPFIVIGGVGVLLNEGEL